MVGSAQRKTRVYLLLVCETSLTFLQDFIFSIRVFPITIEISSYNEVAKGPCGEEVDIEASAEFPTNWRSRVLDVPLGRPLCP